MYLRFDGNRSADKSAIAEGSAPMISTTVLGPLMNGQYPAIHPTGVREYLLWGVVVGVGTGSTALVLSATVVNRWFSRQRGLALGLLGAANSTGRLVFLPLLATCARGPGAHPPPEAPLVPFGVALRQG